MTILNLGSINIDHVYAVEHFVRPGETLASSHYSLFAGGKGFNQSIALARAGAVVRHAGKVGRDADRLLQRLKQEGVDTDRVSVTDTPTGHAIIQVIPSGENAIILYGGANQTVGASDIERALSTCSPGDYLLLQNEISSVADALRQGKARGLTVVFNPAPLSPAVRDYPLDCVDLFILNETEAEGLTGKSSPDEIRIVMQKRFPRSATVLTLGKKGALFFDANTTLSEPALAVQAVDTTAAGDTFIGFFLAEWRQTGNPAKALAQGCRAAAICVTRPGASDSIPRRDELAAF
jgi:ribokinase